MIDMKDVAVWGSGIGIGKVGNLGADYAETAMPTLTNFYFKELVSLVGGPVLVGVAMKLSKGRHQTEADVAGLAGVELFIDRVVKMGAQALGIQGAPVRVMPRAPPPGFLGNHGAPGYSPYATQQRLPFQSDLSY